MNSIPSPAGIRLKEISTSLGSSFLSLPTPQKIRPVHAPTHIELRVLYHCALRDGVRGEPVAASYGEDCAGDGVEVY